MEEIDKIISSSLLLINKHGKRMREEIFRNLRKNNLSIQKSCKS